MSSIFSDKVFKNCIHIYGVYSFIEGTFITVLTGLSLETNKLPKFFFLKIGSKTL